MITTGKNGRRYSKTTFDEAVGIIDHMKQNLTPEERLLVDILGEEELENQVLVKEGLFGHIYHTLPVTMEQFIDDPYFLGESCSTIYPAIKEDLINMFERPYREVILTGSIGVGKTYCLSIAICRILYELSCMISPQKTFGLSSGSEMVIPLISKNLTLAREVMKSAVDDKIKESPYFMTKFAPNIKQDYTLFPHNIRVKIGSYGSDRILGTNIFGSACDECSTKKNIITVENDGIICYKTVGDLFEMVQEGKANCKIVCLDHENNELKAGWWKIKKSSIQSLIQIGTSSTISEFSYEHPILVQRGQWLVYCYSKDIVEGDYVVVEDDYATKRSKVERRSEKEDIRSGKKKNRREESVLWKDAYGRNERKNSGRKSKGKRETEVFSFRRDKEKDEQIPKGKKIFRRDKTKDERICKTSVCRSRMEKETIRNSEKDSCRGQSYPFATSHVWERQSHVWETFNGRTQRINKKKDDRKGWYSSYGRIKRENFRRKRSCYKRPCKKIQVSSSFTRWNNDSVSDRIRIDSCQILMSSEWNSKCRRGRQNGLGRIYNKWSEKANCCRFQSNKRGWCSDYCGRKGTFIFLCRERENKISCDVEILSEEQLQDDISIQQQRSSECIQRAICNSRICGYSYEEKENKDKIDEENKACCNELEFVGVRKERIRVSDLPDGLHLEKILSVKKLGPEQTYSICTEYNTFIADGLVVHNTNFPPKRKGQQIAIGFGQKLKAAHFDIVEKIYRGLVRRIKSRFQKAGGGFPGMVILASSAATVESFTERKLRESKDDPLVFVRDHTQWTAKPKEEFCGEFFYIICSTSATKSRILREDEYDAITDEYLEANDAFIMDIPVEYKEDFESNMEESLRDIAGFSTEAISQFVQRPKMISVCTNTNIVHPFDREEWVAGGPGVMDWNALVVEIERNLPGGFKERAFMPRRNPSAMRWCHVDASISGDSSGLAIGHIDRWVEVVRRDLEGNAHVDQEPYYIIDFMLRINPPPAEQIYMPDIRVMIYDFMAHGFKFIGFSSDTYQYVEMHQQVSRKGIKPRIISMDASTEAYDELKSAFYEKRIEIYYYEPFIEEFKKLEYDRLAGKIDHPLAGSKDCISWDTKISLLNGSEVKVSDLVGKEFWVYSCLPSGDVVPGYARNVHLVGKKDVLRIVLDNGEHFDCTDDHEIMMRNGSFLEAKNLMVGDSIMPLYRDLSLRNSKCGLNGYERIKNNNNSKMLLTHQLVAKECFDFSYGRRIGDRQVIHHSDFNKRNNSPDNLKIMDWHKHRALHCTIASENMKKIWNNKKYREKMKGVCSKIGKKTGTKNITKYNKSKYRINKLKENGIFSRNGSRTMTKCWKNTEFVKNHKERMMGNNNPFARKDITFDIILDVASKSISKREMMDKLKCSEKVIDRILKENKMKYYDIFKEYGQHRPRGINVHNYRADITIDVIKKVAISCYSVGELCKKLRCTNKVYGRVVRENGYNLLEFKNNFFNKREKSNHMVKDVIRLTEKVDVYDLTVDKYHNFAISSGVFVHNCSDAVAGVVQGLKKAASMMPLQGRMAKSPNLSHEHSWVSPLIPADKVDIEAVKAAKEGISKEDYLPILFDGD